MSDETQQDNSPLFPLYSPWSSLACAVVPLPRTTIPLLKPFLQIALHCKGNALPLPNPHDIRTANIPGQPIRGLPHTTGFLPQTKTGRILESGPAYDARGKGLAHCTPSAAP
jgi:hypothetical protein